MNKFLAALRTQGFLMLFGFIITISLFLGDGKQPLIDVVWACEIVLLYAVYFLYNKKPRVLPLALHAAWMFLLGYFIVHTLFSDSVGYSLSTTIRLFDAYLVYNLFYSFADKKYNAFVDVGVIIICVIATTASFGCLVFPQLVHFLPQMNLLYASYGHNQLAGLLLFGTPVVIEERNSLPPWCKKTVFILFLFGMVFSFARGAWVLLAAYLTFLLGTKRLVGKFYISMAIVFVGVSAGLLVTMSLVAPHFVRAPSTPNNDWFYKQTVKPPIYENRIQYWAQALRAIRQRPLFGSGPGTFYLQSKRFQDAPLSYSWFAHNFVLEQGVEIGFVGVFLWAILFVLQGRILLRSRPSPLFMGVVLTFLYSVYEYNLNFLVIWLLFWSALGWLTGTAQFKKTFSPRPPLFVIVGIVILFIFSLFSIGGMIDMGVNKNDVAITSQNQLSLLLFFQRKNPEILYAAAKYYSARKQTGVAAQWYADALLLDPKNFEYNKEYLEFIAKGATPLGIGRAVSAISFNMLPDRLRLQIAETDFSTPFTNGINAKNIPEQLSAESLETYFPKLYYELGIAIFHKDATATRRLWALARDSFPDMGLLYQEEAALELYVFNDMQTAHKIIAECMKVPRAALHCRQITPSLDNVPPPGTIEHDVLIYE